MTETSKKIKPNSSLCVITYPGGIKPSGVATYFYRVALYCKENGIDFYFFKDKSSIITDDWLNKLREEKINLEIFDGTYYDYEKKFANYQRLIIIVPHFYYYCCAARFAKVNNYNCDIYFYVLHPHLSQISPRKWINNFFEKTIIKTIYPDFVFMDEETKDYARRQSPAIPFDAASVLRLGFLPQLIGRDDTFVRQYNSEKIILSITRFDFPFKAYILGLIDDFALLVNSFPDIRLQLIGDGMGMKDVRKKLTTLPDSISGKIELLGDKPYSELNLYLERAYIFVGMGTTLLDAACVGVPGIGAVAYQAENKSFGYFYDNPLCVGCIDSVDSYEIHHFYDLLQNVLLMKKEQYDEICSKMRNIIMKYYSMDYVMDYFIKKSAKRYMKKNFNIRILYYWIKFRYMIQKIKYGFENFTHNFFHD